MNRKCSTLKQPIEFKINRSFGRLIDWLVDLGPCSIDWLIGWFFVDRLIDWLIDWLFDSCLYWLNDPCIPWLIEVFCQVQSDNPVQPGAAYALWCSGKAIAAANYYSTLPVSGSWHGSANASKETMKSAPSLLHRPGDLPVNLHHFQRPHWKFLLKRLKGPRFQRLRSAQL